MKLPSYIPEIADKKYRWVDFSCPIIIYKICIISELQSDHPQQLQAANLPAVLPHLTTSPAKENSGSQSSHSSHQASCPCTASSSSFGARDQNGYKEQVA